MSKVLFISGQSMNDALGAAGRAHRPMFERLGYELLEINFALSEADSLLNAAIAEGSIELAFGVMGMGADVGGATPDGKSVNLWQAIGVPFISLYGDSPSYFLDRHIASTAWHASLYFHPEHQDLRRRLPEPPRLSGLVPPIPFDMTDKREIDFRLKEKGKLLFLKNGNDPEKLLDAWRTTMPSSTFLLLAELASELSGRLTTDVGCDIDAYVTAAFASKGWDIVEFINLRLFFIAQLDDYLRRIKSTMLGEVLADFPVEIRGFNWEHMNFAGSVLRSFPEATTRNRNATFSNR